jgi:hypothetical protein
VGGAVVRVAVGGTVGDGAPAVGDGPDVGRDTSSVGVGVAATCAGAALGLMTARAATSNGEVIITTLTARSASSQIVQRVGARRGPRADFGVEGIRLPPSS